MKYKKQEGITLTILVITIIVMFILAGASLSLIFDKEGVLKSGQTTKEAQENYANREEEKAENLINDVDEEMNGTYKDPSGANAPKLKNGMIPVKWNEDEECWVVTDSNDKEWYSYNDKKWANIMLTDGLVVDGITNASTAKLSEMKNKKVTSVGSMFVWIPRYAYQITNNYHNGGENIKGTINIEFLKDKTNKPVKSSVKIVEYNETTTENYTKFPDGYVVQPAFEYGEQISGIWVAKFEASKSDATATSNGSSNILKIQPSVRSWRSISIGNAYTTCLNYNLALNSHMAKPTEWGATIYLSQSKYGKNSEIGVNECYNCITGAGPSEDNNVGGSTYTYSSVLNAGTFENKYSYKGTQGIKASTTGNIYGIYDMAGCAYEYVVAYLDNSYVKEPGTEGAATSNNRYANGESLIKGANKTKEVYKVADSDECQKNYEINKEKYGNMIWETSKDGGDTGERAWYKNWSYFVETNAPYLIFGGYNSDSNQGGLFGFNADFGKASSISSFRPILVIQ